MQIQGNWFAANSSALQPAVLHIRGEQYSLSIAGQEPVTGTLASLVVSDRLGNVERRLGLDDGSVFTTRDNDSVDLAIKGNTGSAGIVHTMESRWRWVIMAVAVTVFFIFSFFRWGMPAISEGIAHALPQKTNVLIAGSTLEFLDKYVFEETQLNQEHIREITEHFAAQLVPLDDRNSGINYTLHFRDWPGIPNALALPSGDIILTDAFVELAENQAQIDSVLLHEMGHIINRHSLEMVIEATIFSTIVMLVTGDSNGIADMGIGLGSLFVNSHYSRNHETEADHYAFNKMLQAGIDPLAFAEIMESMSHSMQSSARPPDEPDEEEPGEHAPGEEEPGEDDPSESGIESVVDYLSTHPNTTKRINQARQFSECFKRGELVCTLTD